VLFGVSVMRVVLALVAVLAVRVGSTGGRGRGNGGHVGSGHLDMNRWWYGTAENSWCHCKADDLNDHVCGHFVWSWAAVNERYGRSCRCSGGRNGGHDGTGQFDANRWCYWTAATSRQANDGNVHGGEH
jgi:hypothetical protein